MSKFLCLMDWVTIVFLVCTLICGAWVGKHPESDMHFHAVFSAISVIIALVTIILHLCNR